jgi:hypothetical protein
MARQILKETLGDESGCTTNSVLVSQKISGVALGIQYEPTEFAPTACYVEQGSHQLPTAGTFSGDEHSIAKHAISPGSTLSMA